MQFSILFPPFTYLYFQPSFVWHPFLYQGGGNWTLTTYCAINNQLQRGTPNAIEMIMATNFLFLNLFFQTLFRSLPGFVIIALCVFPCQLTFLKFLNVNIHFMLILNRKVSIPFVGDAKIPKFWPGIKNFIIFTPKMTFLGEKLKGWSDKVEIFVTYRSNYLQK